MSFSKSCIPYPRYQRFAEVPLRYHTRRQRRPECSCKTTDLLQGRSRGLDVYEIWSEERACHCVAKTLRPDRADDRKKRKRLFIEGRILKRLTHLHIVRTCEVYEEPLPVVILETLTGDTRLIAVHRPRS